jgi:Asparagine synthase
MLITAGEPPFGEQDIRCASWEDDRFLVRWKGLIFVYGVSSGSATIQQIVQRLGHTPLTSLCHELHGVFGLFIFDKARCLWQIVVDNSGLYHVFHDHDTVSSSFLELVAFKKLSSRHICRAAAAEFVAHGGVYWRRTLVDGIGKIGYDEVILLEPGSAGTEGGKRIARKQLPPPGGNQESLLAHYAYLAEALAGRRVSVDLTGGFDSRLNACLLARQGLDFEVAMSGRPGISDVVISKQVAQMLGKELYLTQQDISSLDADLRHMFHEGDGSSDVVLHHLAQQRQAERKSRGIEVAISGVGGELYKDFWWLQDMPRYSSRRINFERLYDLRIMPIPLPPHYLAGDVAEAYAQLRRDTLERFADLRRATNTETYDNIYFYYKMPEFAGRFLTNETNNYLDIAAPLLDYENVMVGFGLPRSVRFFNRFHRRVLSEQCPKLARLMTTSGVSASAGGWHLAGDTLGYSINIGRRLSRKIGQRLFGCTWLPPTSPGESTMRSRVRRSPEFLQSMAALKDLHMIAVELSPEAIRDADVGRILTLGMLVRHLGC